MNIKEYGNAIVSWASIEDCKADEALRRIVLMGNGAMYASELNGNLWQWVNREWHMICEGNQEIGASIPIKEEV